MNRIRRIKPQKITALLLVIIMVLSLFLSLLRIALDNKKEEVAKKPEEPKVEEIKRIEGYDELKAGGLTEEEIKEIQELPNYRPENASRYAKYQSDSIERRVLEVNCDLDLKPYDNPKIIEDDSDMTILINKTNKLPDEYVPSDLEDLSIDVMNNSEDYTFPSEIELRKEVKAAFLSWYKAALNEGLYMTPISGYRDFEYQQNLWENSVNTSGQEYADSYFARPGYSEHNAGLAVDIELNGAPYNTIHLYSIYQWVLENAHNYGFILRYPEGKEDITRYEYESWHFRYVGIKAATEIYENGWTLEEYLANQPSK